MSVNQIKNKEIPNNNLFLKDLLEIFGNKYTVFLALIITSGVILDKYSENNKQNNKQVDVKESSTPCKNILTPLGKIRCDDKNNNSNFADFERIFTTYNIGGNSNLNESIETQKPKLKKIEDETKVKPKSKKPSTKILNPKKINEKPKTTNIEQRIKKLKEQYAIRKESMRIIKLALKLGININDELMQFTIDHLNEFFKNESNKSLLRSMNDEILNQFITYFNDAIKNDDKIMINYLESILKTRAEQIDNIVSDETLSNKSKNNIYTALMNTKRIYEYNKLLSSFDNNLKTSKFNNNPAIKIALEEALNFLKEADYTELKKAIETELNIPSLYSKLAIQQPEIASQFIKSVTHASIEKLNKLEITTPEINESIEHYINTVKPEDAYTGILDITESIQALKTDGIPITKTQIDKIIAFQKLPTEEQEKYISKFFNNPNNHNENNFHSNMIIITAEMYHKSQNQE